MAPSPCQNGYDRREVGGPTDAIWRLDPRPRWMGSPGSTEPVVLFICASDPPSGRTPAEVPSLTSVIAASTAAPA
jgi:hypothetical protein